MENSMMELSPAEIIAIAVGVSSWIGTYYQGRSVRIAESQLKAQLNSLQDVVNRIETERKERERMIEAEAQERLRLLKEAKAALHDEYWGLHRLNRDTSGGAHVILTKHISDLSLCISLLSTTLLSGDASLDVERRELIEIVGQLSRATAIFSDTESKYGFDMINFYEAVQEGRQQDDPESILARYDDEFEKAKRERTLSLGRLATYLEKLKERNAKEA
jgi:hypothetical protein